MSAGHSWCACLGGERDIQIAGKELYRCCPLPSQSRYVKASEVCVKASEVCAFAVTFQFITLHLEQVKARHLQSVTDFGRGRNNWSKSELELLAPSSTSGTLR